MVPLGLRDETPRACEAVFIRSPFWNRCKPGSSHHGPAMDLRRASVAAIADIAGLLADRGLPHGPEIRPGMPLVEAFPNTFLGVLLPAQAYSAKRVRRRKKFDWLYERALETGAIERVLTTLGWAHGGGLSQFENETNHEKRAALICLLTAGVAHAGRATVVGDKAGGWFWLPPLDLWADWARDGLVEAIGRARNRGFPEVGVWSSSTAGEPVSVTIPNEIAGARTAMAGAPSPLHSSRD